VSQERTQEEEQRNTKQTTKERGSENKNRFHIQRHRGIFEFRNYFKEHEWKLNNGIFLMLKNTIFIRKKQSIF
jgi:hypothetical protein